jgi:hypothetical protein
MIRIIISFTSVEAKDKIFNVQELLLHSPTQKDKKINNAQKIQELLLPNYCCFYCSERMQNIELLLHLLFKRDAEYLLLFIFVVFLFF